MRSWLRPSLRPNMHGIPGLVLDDLLTEIRRRHVEAVESESIARTRRQIQHGTPSRRYADAELVLLELMRAE